MAGHSGAHPGGRRPLAFLVAFLVALVSSRASAAPDPEAEPRRPTFYTMGTVGVLGSFGSHANGPPSTGVGVEATFDWFPSGFGGWALPKAPFFLGAIAQGQLVGTSHGRFLLGAQGGSVIGVELGPSLETRDADRGYATTLGLHVAPYLGLGVINVALRVGVPLQSYGEGQRYGTDVAAVVTLKLPSNVFH